MTCPKCGAARPAEATECPQCGIIYERFAKKRASSLTTCPACGKEVSRQAPACPGCGQPVAGGAVAGAVGNKAGATREDQEEDKRKASAQAGMGCFIGCGALVLFCLAILMFGDVKNTTTPPAANSPSAGEPFVKTRNVPIVIDDHADIIGCHDINDYWMALGLRSGDRDAQLRPRLADGRCGRIAAGRGNAVEILPSGVAEIRDSRGVKWYVNDADLKAHHAH